MRHVLWHVHLDPTGSKVDLWKGTPIQLGSSSNLKCFKEDQILSCFEIKDVRKESKSKKWKSESIYLTYIQSFICLIWKGMDWLACNSNASNEIDFQILHLSRVYLIRLINSILKTIIYVIPGSVQCWSTPQGFIPFEKECFKWNCECENCEKKIKFKFFYNAEFTLQKWRVFRSNSFHFSFQITEKVWKQKDSWDHRTDS